MTREEAAERLGIGVQEVLFFYRNGVLNGHMTNAKEADGSSVLRISEESVVALETKKVHVEGNTK
ncbi:hypothetical protein HN854_02345 [Candidatus Peregrinibacteria bacterium]|nr:hypothetical protein [Candidatus Peregrinibacteria bacterium]MBT4585680.1 hypothetical protein [Candidatus Peregrinibacteria bacterium]MBT6730445.1 hypothetical protein [Candidatus Peregrinibacteria bacterium]MBT7344852.1 hypothetical protein [Candidatus Peregrinibacteria bacterium]